MFGLSEKFFGLSEKYCPWPPQKHGTHGATVIQLTPHRRFSVADVMEYYAYLYQLPT
jgi:hypothetical protein